MIIKKFKFWSIFEDTQCGSLCYVLLFFHFFYLDGFLAPYVTEAIECLEERIAHLRASIANMQVKTFNEFCESKHDEGHQEYIRAIRELEASTKM